MLLLVDDDDLFRSALATNLREDGRDVMEFASAHAVPLEGVQNVEALITDFMIGDENGARLAERFRSIFPTTPVIVMSSAIPDLIRQAGAPDDAVILSKPFDYDRLLALLPEAKRAPCAGGTAGSV